MNQMAFEPYKEVGVDATWNKECAKETSNINIFYKTEERFLDYLFDFEEEKARNEASKLINMMEDFVEKKYYSTLKYYLIELIGTISRQMKKSRIPVEKTFSFSSTGIKLVEVNLTDKNAVDILNEIIVLFAYKTENREHPNLFHQTVNEVIEYVDEEILSSLSVEGLAKKFNVSTSHLSRIFREYSGITLVEYINIKKVEESQYYLRFSNEKISDISDNFHFCNQSYFTRIFKKYTGLTPRKFKKSMKGNYFKFHLHEEK